MNEESSPLPLSCIFLTGVTELLILNHPSMSANSLLGSKFFAYRSSHKSCALKIKILQTRAQNLQVYETMKLSASYKV
jgi:hypothetical protein